MVEVFKTNVQQPGQARQISGMLQRHFPGSKINFDLEDCDKILRVKGEDFIPEKIVMLVKENGFICEVLE